MTNPTGARAFAKTFFGHAELGDHRRSSALVDIVAIHVSALTRALAAAVSAMARRLSMFYVVVDGSSLTFPPLRLSRRQPPPLPDPLPRLPPGARGNRGRGGSPPSVRVLQRPR